MTIADKQAKILSAAASHGWTPDVYWDIAQDLKARGLIELRQVWTTGGNRKQRWFLV